MGRRAQIFPAAGFHILRHTHASQLVQKGVPLPVIAAQLGHADTRICEKHYAHLTPNYIADTIRANFPQYDIEEEDSKIVNIV
ncbi:MAG: tyrosine-type recombinase/integrase [Pseudomonadota bacterium]